MNGPVPLLLIVGFCGAGKTALLARWAADPEFAQGAVLSNELGGVGIDNHSLPAAVATSVLRGGCACCTAREALGPALLSILEDRARGKVRAAPRVVLEAAGFADPLAIVQLLEWNEAVRGKFRLEGVIAVVDGVEGEAQLEAWREAAEQVAIADAIVVAKADLASAMALDSLEARLAALNPHASITRSAEGSAHPQLVLAAVHDAAGREERRRRAASMEQPTALEPGESRSLAATHGANLRVTTLKPAAPVEAESLRTQLETLLDRHGAKVLRVKGLVAIEGQPGPAILQAVGGTLYPVRLTMRWPEGATSGIVVVADGVPESDIAALLP